MRKHILTLGLLCLIALPLIAQKSKLNQGYIAYQDAANGAVAKYNDAITAIATGLKNTEGFKPEDFAKAYTRLGQSYMGLYATTLPQLIGKYPNLLLDAYEAFKNARKYDTKQKFESEIKLQWEQLAVDMYYKSYELQKAKDFKGALYHQDAAIEISHNELKRENYAFYQMRAYTKLSLNDTLGSVNDFIATIDAFKNTPPTDPKQLEDAEKGMPDLYRFIAELSWMNLNDDERAIKYYNEGRAKYPDNKDLASSELTFYTNKPALQDVALAKLEKATTENPTEDNLTDYGTLLMKKDQEKAFEIYKKVLMLNPRNYIANLNSGAIIIDKAQKAITDAEASKDEKSRKKLIEEGKGFFQQALPYLEAALEEKQDNENVIKALIQIYTYLEMNDKAEEMIKKRKALSGE